MTPRTPFIRTVLRRAALALLLLKLGALPAEAAEEDASHGTPANPPVILDETGVRNLQIQTAEAEETAFEETIFALGEMEALPGKRAVVSSRIPGRAFSVLALPDQKVDEGEELMWVESRQPGDPPPTVMLAAPISGTIARVDIAQGQPISPDQSLIEILDLSQVEAAARVPQHLAGRLAKDQKARIRVSGFPDRVFEARLAHVGVYADGPSGTVEAAFHLPNEEGLLRPGMRAEFNIVVSQRENVTSVPRHALLGDESGRYVYVKDFDLPHAFIKSPVETGAMNDTHVEVLSGLLPGDEVVVHGGYALSFAGKGTVSLKEALDAAHGHEHNEDGSELTAEQKKAQEQHEDHDHGGLFAFNLVTWFFAGLSALLLVLLIVAVATRPRRSVS